MWLFLGVMMLFFVFGVVVCGGDDGGGGSDKIKVGFVMDIGGVDDCGFNEFLIKGFDKVEVDFDIEKWVYVLNLVDDYELNLEVVVDDGNDFVVVVGFLFVLLVVKVVMENFVVSS